MKLEPKSDGVTVPASLCDAATLVSEGTMTPEDLALEEVVMLDPGAPAISTRWTSRDFVANLAILKVSVGVKNATAKGSHMRQLPSFRLHGRSRTSK